MKKINAFEHRIGWGGIEVTVEEVNDYIEKLNSNGIKDVEILPTTTGKGVVYTLIWDDTSKEINND